MSKESAPSLETNIADALASGVRGTSGLIPVLGPALSEVITNLIPNQRLSRIVDYLEQLDARIGDIERSKLERPEAISLIEEGGRHAAFSISPERRRQIANLVADGLTEDERRILGSSRLLRLLDQVDDAQLLLLARHHWPTGSEKEFRERHPEVFQINHVTLADPQERKDELRLEQLARDQLVALGLLRVEYQLDRAGTAVVDRRTGMPTPTRYIASALGDLLLRSVGIASPKT